MGRYLEIKEFTHENMIKVTGLSYDATIFEIKDFFNTFTDVKWVDLKLNKDG
jgi:hypothetical protein